MTTLALAPAATAQDRPLSAIDWLSDSVSTDPAKIAPDEPATTGGVGVETITVTPLGEVTNDAVGLLPASVTGLPRDAWGLSSSAELADLFTRAQGGLLPAMQDMLMVLLLAELDPPADTDPGQRLFLARIDTLMAQGAVEPAQALLERAGPDAARRDSQRFPKTCQELLGTLAPGLSNFGTSRNAARRRREVL